MNRKISTLLLFTILISVTGFSQEKANLKSKIEKIISKYNAKVGVAIHNEEFNDSLIINGDHHYPLQSTYKFHLGIAILDQVDKGNLKLDQPIKISKEFVTTNMYSPIKDKYPDGTTLPLSRVLEYTIQESDNVGCDVMFEMLGGPDQVQKYFVDHGYSGLSIKLTEAIQQANWELQFQNWTTVNSSNKIMDDYYTNNKKLLSDHSHKFLWDTMRATSTGIKRVKGLLPKGTVVAHKTGTSGTNKSTGITAAVNDIAVVSLPNNKVFYISVYVTDSKENDAENEKIIAEVSKAAYDYYNK